MEKKTQEALDHFSNLCDLLDSVNSVLSGYEIFTSLGVIGKESLKHLYVLVRLAKDYDERVIVLDEDSNKILCELIEIISDSRFNEHLKEKWNGILQVQLIQSKEILQKIVERSIFKGGVE